MALFLFAFWLILSGGVRLDVVLMGLAVTGLIWLFACRFLDWSPRREAAVYRCLPVAATFVCLVLEEIVKANVCVMRLLWGGHPKPVIRTFRTGLLTNLGRVLLCNAITLTPGTLTLKCEGDELTVHCLDESLAGGLENSALEQKIQKLEETMRG